MGDTYLDQLQHTHNFCFKTLVCIRYIMNITCSYLTIASRYYNWDRQNMSDGIIRLDGIHLRFCYYFRDWLTTCIARALTILADDKFGWNECKSFCYSSAISPVLLVWKRSRCCLSLGLIFPGSSNTSSPISPVVNSKERTRIATPWSTWRCTLVLSTTVRKVCGLSCILMKFSTLIHVICYNIMPIPCVFVWGLRIDDLSIYVYSNLLKNWSPVHTIPYYRPQPI